MYIFYLAMYLIKGYFLHCNVFTFKYMTLPYSWSKAEGVCKEYSKCFSDTAFVDQTC